MLFQIQLSERFSLTESQTKFSLPQPVWRKAGQEPMAWGPVLSPLLTRVAASFWLVMTCEGCQSWGQEQLNPTRQQLKESYGLSYQLPQNMTQRFTDHYPGKDPEDYLVLFLSIRQPKEAKGTGQRANNLSGQSKTRTNPPDAAADSQAIFTRWRCCYHWRNTANITMSHGSRLRQKHAVRDKQIKQHWL